MKKINYSASAASSFAGSIIIGMYTIILVGFMALATGTFLWWIWPHSIPYIFPGAVDSGLISAEPRWWSVILFTWICGIIFNPRSTKKETLYKKEKN